MVVKADTPHTFGGKPYLKFEVCPRGFGLYPVTDAATLYDQNLTMASSLLLQRFRMSDIPCPTVSHSNLPD